MFFVATPFVHSRPGLPSTHAVPLPSAHVRPWPPNTCPVVARAQGPSSHGMVTTTVIPPSVSFPPIRFFPSDWAVVKGAHGNPACLGTACAQGASLFALDAHIVAGMCVGTGHVAGVSLHQPALLCILSSHQLNLKGRKYHLE